MKNCGGESDIELYSDSPTLLRGIEMNTLRDEFEKQAVKEGLRL